MTKATEAARETWLIVASLIGQGAVWVAFVLQYGYSRGGDGACFRAGAPDTAVVLGDTPQVTADVTFLPIGRACVYEAKGGGTVTVQTGEDATALAIIGTAVCLVAAIAALVRWKHLTAMQRLLPGVALFLLTLGWTVLWLHAAVR
ncbi:hypothetical protein R2Q81_10365 [Microbacterium aquimaris]|uniref:hypothetical protein n=1 Tax=Microbacterium aquimaris TaxID=459816 RepID=UPI002AD3BE0E|nr:hypothetical protein [Microbacterium aquimaris]MDZ8276349.1 hypothetical protein [Microbacterium aquimaris]